MARVQPADGDWAAYRALIETRQPFRDFEMLHRADDGSLRHLSLSGTPLFDALGGWRGYTGVASDRTPSAAANGCCAWSTASPAAWRMHRPLPRVDAGAARDLRKRRLGLRRILGGRCRRPDAALRRPLGQAAAAHAGSFARGEGFEFGPGVGLAGRVWLSREPLWVADVSTDARMLRKDLAREAGLKGALLFPTLAAGEVCGVFAFWSQSIRQPDERLLQAIRIIGSQVGQFLLRKQAETVLRASEERFRALTALSSDWYWEQDVSGRFVRIEGRQGDTMAGWVGQHPRQIGLQPEGGWEQCDALLAAHQPFRDLVLKLETETGRLVLSLSGEPVIDGRGSFPAGAASRATSPSAARPKSASAGWRCTTG